MAKKTCPVEGCSTKVQPGWIFCKRHQIKIFAASKSSKTIPEIYEKLTHEECVAYDEHMTALMRADHAAQEAFGEPLYPKDDRE